MTSPFLTERLWRGVAEVHVKRSHGRQRIIGSDRVLAHNKCVLGSTRALDDLQFTQIRARWRVGASPRADTRARFCRSRFRMLAQPELGSYPSGVPDSTARAVGCRYASFYSFPRPGESPLAFCPMLGADRCICDHMDSACCNTQHTRAVDSVNNFALNKSRHRMSGNGINSKFGHSGTPRIGALGRWAI